MSLRITWIPTFKVPETTVERVPALAKMRSTLRRRYELSVFDWTIEEAKDPAERLSALARDIRETDCVITEAPAAPLLFSAMQQERSTSPNLVALGMWVTARTLRSLGLADVVRADRTLSETGGRLRQNIDFLGRLIGDTPARDLEHTVPWDNVFQLEDWQDELDLLSLGPFPDVNALLFSSGRFPLLAEGEMESIFQRLFPLSTIAHLQRYPFGLEDASVADEVIDQLLPFLDSLPADRAPTDNRAPQPPS